MKRLIALFSLSFSVAAAQTIPRTSAGQTLTVRHQDGTTVVPLHPKRVVVIGTYILQFAYVLKEKSVVGLAFDPKYSASGVKVGADGKFVLPAGSTFFRYGSLSGVTHVGTEAAPSLEAIAALKPDLIVRSWWPGIDGYKGLSSIAPTISLDETRDNAWQTALRSFAPIFGKSAQAELAISNVTRQEVSLKAQLQAEGVLNRTPNALVLSPGDGSGDNYYLYTRARVVPTLRRLGFKMVYPGGGESKYDSGELGSYVSGEVMVGLPRNTLITYLQYLKTPAGPTLAGSKARVLDYVVEPDGPWIGPYADLRYLKYLKAQLLPGK